MKTLGNIYKKLVNRILASKNEKLLEAIDKIFDYTQPEDIIALSAEALEMLLMSEKENEQEFYFFLPKPRTSYSKMKNKFLQLL